MQINFSKSAITELSMFLCNQKLLMLPILHTYPSNKYKLTEVTSNLRLIQIVTSEFEALSKQ